jgi:general stress protein 26
MCIINDRLKIYFQTDSKFEKVRNIRENNKVAINLGDYYFKGTAKIIGHPTTNSSFIEKIKIKHPKTYESYTNLKDEILIEVDLTECKIWGVDNSKSIHEQETIIIIDMINKSIKTIACDKM